VLDATDKEREGGAIAGFPDRLLYADMREDGPWWIGFVSVPAAETLIKWHGTALVVDLPGGMHFHETTCKMAVDHDSRDEQAYTMAETGGFWGEMYLSRELVYMKVEDLVIIIVAQLRVLITQAKWPRVSAGEAKNHTKVCFKALLDPSQEPRHPPQLIVRNGVYAVPVRYRLQAEQFPDRCGRCHFLLAACVCALHAAANAAKKELRQSRAAEAREATVRRAAEGGGKGAGKGKGASKGAGKGGGKGKGKGAGRGEASGSVNLLTDAERLKAHRERRDLVRRCGEQGICVFNLTKSCAWGLQCLNSHNKVRMHHRRR